jgi:cobalt/nickel transport system permease protein
VAAGHGVTAGTDGLLIPGESVAHRLPAEVKIVAVVVFVLAAVATPREAFGAFAVYGALVVVVAWVARVPLLTMLRRLRIEVPFLAFAVFLPVVGASPRVNVLGGSLSEPGLWAAWNILVKGTLGVSASIILAATTPVAGLLRGLERLHLPRALTAIAGFMVRYLDVIVAEANRMSIARQSRGYEARWLWQAKAVASSAGTLFVRSFERGERVHLAMVSRGYAGTMPTLDDRVTTAHDWSVALLVPAVAVAVAVAANVVT